MWKLERGELADREDSAEQIQPKRFGADWGKI